MYVSNLRIDGLRAAPTWARADLDRVVELPPGPAGVAVADGLTLLAAALDVGRTRADLVALGWLHPGRDPDIVEEGGLPVQARMSDPGAVTALIDADSTRKVTVTAEVELDPPLFGRLRELAVREPRLVTALGQSPSVQIKVGWLLTQDHRVAAIAVSEVGVGSVSFSLTGADRPEWIGPLLKDLGSRFSRVDPTEPEAQVTRRLLAASLSGDPAVRVGFGRAATALGEPPLSLGRLELVQAEGRTTACFGPSLLRSRHFGPAALEALQLATAVHVLPPDVLIVEAAGSRQADPEAIRAWLASATEGDGATLEQVWLVPGGGA